MRATLTLVAAVVAAWGCGGTTDPSGVAVCTSGASGTAGTLPIFVRPFGGSYLVVNYFDHDRPARATNGRQITFCGVEYAGFVDGHTGYDWIMATGTSLRAVADGEVLAAGPEQQFSCGVAGATPGLIVQLRHAVPPDTFVTVYAHLSRVDVAPGSLVRAGDPIGLSGNTGCSTEPHLHFEVWRTRADGSETYTDPYGWSAVSDDPWAAHASGAPSVWLWRPGEAPSVVARRR